MGNFSAFAELKGVEEFAEEFDFSVWVVIVSESIDCAYVNPSADEVGCHLVGFSRCVRVLE